MSAFTDMNDLSLDDLTAIVDALFTGDPSGTNADKAYMKEKVFKLIQALGKANFPTNCYFVSPNYASLGKPYYADPAAAHAQIVIDGCTSGNKALMILHGKGDSFNNVLNLNIGSGYVCIIGTSMDNNIISQNITISAGTYIFANVKLAANLTVATGARAKFKHSSQAAGQTTTVSGGSTLLVSDCEVWGATSVSGNENKVWFENLKDCGKNGSNKSIVLAAGMTGGEYVARNCCFQGDIQEDTPMTEFPGSIRNALPRPIF